MAWGTDGRRQRLGIDSWQIKNKQESLTANETDRSILTPNQQCLRRLLMCSLLSLAEEHRTSQSVYRLPAVFRRRLLDGRYSANEHSIGNERSHRSCWSSHRNRTPMHDETAPILEQRQVCLFIVQKRFSVCETVITRIYSKNSTYNNEKQNRTENKQTNRRSSKLIVISMQQ